MYYSTGSGASVPVSKPVHTVVSLARLVQAMVAGHVRPTKAVSGMQTFPREGERDIRLTAAMHRADLNR